jgi:hypothetical protein
MESELPKSLLEQPRTVIRASGGWASLRLQELWRYRELLFFSRLAPRQGPLQADCIGASLGDTAAIC